MKISPDTQAVLLMTAQLGGCGGARPLTPGEWGRFADWMKGRALTPARFVSGSVAELLEGWQDSKVTVRRLSALLAQGTALAFAMEKWARVGIWVMIRSDPDYPRRLKLRLGGDSPAVLFGCGDRKLLGGSALAVVGSRDCGREGLAYGEGLGASAAGHGCTVVSGGARGVDDAVMQAALAAGGTVVGVLAHGLLGACLGKRYRSWLMENRLVLISPFNPEAGFNVGHAMQRNRYIYCLADAAVVVHSGRKGGTWSGAVENLANGWVPLYVGRMDGADAGNGLLVQKGATWVPEPLEFGQLFQGSHAEQLSLFGDSVVREAYIKPESPQEMSFYELFLARVQVLCSEACSVGDLMESLLVGRSQLNLWLKRAVAEGRLRKLSRPVRYQWIAD